MVCVTGWTPITRWLIARWHQRLVDRQTNGHAQRLELQQLQFIREYYMSTAMACRRTSETRAKTQSDRWFKTVLPSRKFGIGGECGDTPKNATKKQVIFFEQIFLTICLREKYDSRSTNNTKIWANCVRFYTERINCPSVCCCCMHESLIVLKGLTCKRVSILTRCRLTSLLQSCMTSVTPLRSSIVLWNPLAEAGPQVRRQSHATKWLPIATSLSIRLDCHIDGLCQEDGNCIFH